MRPRGARLARCRRRFGWRPLSGSTFRGRRQAPCSGENRAGLRGASLLFKRRDSGCEGRSRRVASPLPLPPPRPRRFPLRRRSAAAARDPRAGLSAPAPTAQVHWRDRGKGRKSFPRRCASAGSGRGGKLLPFLQQPQELLNSPHLEGLSSSYLSHQVPLPQQSHGIRETTGSRITHPPPLPLSPPVACYLVCLAVLLGSREDL